MSSSLQSSVTKEYKRLFTLFKENPDAYEAEKRRRMYPDPDQKDFSEKLIQKKEFARNRSIPLYSLGQTDYDDIANTMCSSKDFRLSPHQNFVSNFLSPQTPYNGLLLFAGVGVGKTASAISVAEKYYETYKKRVLIILSGNIKENFKKQIFDITKYDIISGTSTLVTGTKYPDMIFDKELLSKDVIEKRINKILKERYQFMGYKELVILLQKIEARVEEIERNPEKRPARVQEKIRELFSNRLIIIDEAHNLRMPSETGKKQMSTAFLGLLNQVENTKLMLMTATPMFNESREIIWLLNLLLTNDKQPTIKASNLFDASGKLTTDGAKRLKQIASRYISFMRGENPFSFPFRLYPSINNDPLVIKKFPSKDLLTKKAITTPIKHLELYGSVMSPFQRSIYDKYKSKTIISDDEGSNALSEEPETPILDGEEDDDISNDVQNLVQVSNVAYPSGDTGKSAFDKVVSRSDKRLKYQKNSEEIFAYDNLSKYAPKIKTIIDKILSSKGIVFVYSQYYYSGIYPLAMALEHIGFRKYNNASGGLVEGIKPTQQASHLKSPSYIVLSRDRLLSPNNDAEIAAAKSIDNSDGSKIKVIIVSKIGTEGIDFKRIREIHLLEPWYNLNRIEQIIGRGVRTCSHIDMPKEQRNVTIYLHANQYDKDHDEESVDLRMYRISEAKQVNIANVERVLKESSLDCPLNNEMLNMSTDRIGMSFDIETAQGKIVKKYQVGDRDNSFLCGFGSCDIKCNVSPSKVPQSKNANSSTFTPAFVSSEIELYRKYIANMFKANKAYTLEECIKYLEGEYKIIDQEVLEYTLMELVENRIPLVSLNGYLIKRGRNYVFQSSSLNIRATLSERATMKSRPGKLDISKAIRDSPPKTKETLVDSKKKESVNKSEEDIFQKLESRLEDINKLLVKLKVTGINRSTIIDHIVDTLTQTELYSIVGYFSTKAAVSQIQKDVMRSFNDTRVFVLNSPGNISYFYDHFTGKFMNGLTQDIAGPLEISKVRKDYDRIMGLVGEPLSANVKGYIGKNKNLEPKFKVRDNPNTSGYVCSQTSSLEIEELKRRVKIDDSKFDPKTKLVKAQLCIVYELQMRQSNDFKRPYTMKN